MKTRKTINQAPPIVDKHEKRDVVDIMRELSFNNLVDGWWKNPLNIKQCLSNEKHDPHHYNDDREHPIIGSTYCYAHGKKE